MISKSILIGIFLAFNAYAVSLAQSAEAVVGTWYTTDQRGKVEVYPCGDTFCGKIVWLKEPENTDGTPILDKGNPNESLRERTIVGINILEDLTYEGEGEYEDGEIYDPESGKTYSCLMRLKKGGNELEVRGYVGISLVGRSEKWIRAK
ncbi:DUF2147 domain-containing protein [Tunicatimonas pelagia]|uniref:DUF2147 domain-containing protein n=1 Tax=Tunicatimonas pelagia TaxID=931531 RepID=UPI002665DBF5|nr:DUF2147 domain-containing protein [Tunicatimonas pelagia]WKN43486.1 DUF2147 domain-containing protein [Tunicatimonas pelagia]